MSLSFRPKGEIFAYAGDFSVAPTHQNDSFSGQMDFRSETTYWCKTIEQAVPVTRKACLGKVEKLPCLRAIRNMRAKKKSGAASGPLL
jgi:hypothetical protein